MLLISHHFHCVCANYASPMASASPEQKKVCSEEEIPHQASRRCAAHHQLPELHEGMHAMLLSV